MKNKESFFFNELVHVLIHLFLILFLILAVYTERYMHKLKEKKLAMSVVILFNQAKPVSEGLDLANLLKLWLVKLA